MLEAAHLDIRGGMLCGTLLAFFADPYIFEGERRADGSEGFPQVVDVSLVTPGCFTCTHVVNIVGDNCRDRSFRRKRIVVSPVEGRFQLSEFSFASCRQSVSRETRFCFFPT